MAQTIRQAAKTPSLRPAKNAWSKEKIVEAILHRADTHQLLNAQAVAQDDSALLAAARRRFGTWSEALRAAGIDPEKARPATRRRPRGYWTKERIVGTIQDYARRGIPLHAHHMHQTDNALVAAATYHFGSWAKALESAGFDAEIIRHTTKRSAEQIISDIRGLPDDELRDSVARRHHRALYGAAQVHFGSWAKAVAAAGIDYSRIAANHPWTRKDIEAVVLEYLAAGYELQRALRRHSRLKAAIIREWGSVENLRKHLGLAPDHPIGDLHQGKRLRRLRMAVHVTLPDLSEKTGIPTAVLQAYEQGLSPLPFVVARQLAAAFHLSLDELTNALNPEDSLVPSSSF